MGKGWWVVPGIVALVLAVVPGADAAVRPATDVDGAFGAAQRLTGRECRTPRFAPGADGVTRGFVDCGGKLAFVRSTSSGWQGSATTIAGTPGAVADDGTTTFALYVTEDPANEGFDQLRLLRRSRSGATTTQLVKARMLNAADEYSLVAKAGRWRAVWGELNGETFSRLWDAGTLGGTVAARYTGLPGRAPTTILDGSTVLTAYVNGYRPEGNTIRWGKPDAAGAWTSGPVSPGTGSLDEADWWPAIARVGPNVVVAYRHRTVRGDFEGVYDIVVATRRSTGWWRSTIPSAAVGQVFVADDRGAPVIGWTAQTPYIRGNHWFSDVERVALAQRRNGAWHVRRVNDPRPEVLLEAMWLRNGRLVTVATAQSGAPPYLPVSRGQ